MTQCYDDTDLESRITVLEEAAASLSRINTNVVATQCEFLAYINDVSASVVALSERLDFLRDLVYTLDPQGYEQQILDLLDEAGAVAPAALNPQGHPSRPEFVGPGTDLT